MVVEAPFPADAVPYDWNVSQSPLSEDIAHLWHEVASGIDKSQTGMRDRLSHGGSGSEFFSIVTRDCAV